MQLSQLALCEDILLRKLFGTKIRMKGPGKRGPGGQQDKKKAARKRG